MRALPRLLGVARSGEPLLRLPAAGLPLPRRLFAPDSSPRPSAAALLARAPARLVRLAGSSSHFLACCAFTLAVFFDFCRATCGALSPPRLYGSLYHHCRRQSRPASRRRRRRVDVDTRAARLISDTPRSCSPPRWLGCRFCFWVLVLVTPSASPNPLLLKDVNPLAFARAHRPADDLRKILILRAPAQNLPPREPPAGRGRPSVDAPKHVVMVNDCA